MRSSSICGTGLRRVRFGPVGDEALLALSRSGDELWSTMPALDSVGVVGVAGGLIEDAECVLLVGECPYRRPERSVVIEGVEAANEWSVWLEEDEAWRATGMRARSPSVEGTETAVGELMTLLRWLEWPKPTLMRFRPERREARLLLHMGGGESWLLAVETLEGVRESELVSERAEAPGNVLGVYTPLLALRGCSPSRTLNGSRLCEGNEPARSVLRLGAAEPKLITSISSSVVLGRWGMGGATSRTYWRCWLRPAPAPAEWEWAEEELAEEDGDMG